MWCQLLSAFRMAAVLTVLTGVVYPALVTGVALAMFPNQARGSLIYANGRVVGSELIGQNFVRPEYFHPRPSAAGTDGYDATASGGSNYGPTSRKLIERVEASVERYRKENLDYGGPIPADAVTASGSGLDPHISPANAEIQSARVAKARGVTPSAVRNIVAQAIEPPWLGFIGEPRVNVLRLNLTLDRQWPRQEPAARRGATE